MCKMRNAECGLRNAQRGLRRHSVKRQRAVARDHRAGPHQRAGPLRRRTAARMLEHYDAAGREMLPGRGDYRVDLLVVWWIKNHDVERRGVKVVERAADAGADNNIAVRPYTAVGEVRLDQRLRAAVALDEGNVDGAAARRLDADRAGAGVAIEDARASHPR